MPLKFFGRFLLIAATAVLFRCTPGEEEEVVQIQTPEKLYGQLFYDVQTNPRIFPDRKTFVDCVPLGDVEKIREDYAALTDKSDEAIRDFILNHFIVPQSESQYVSDTVSAQEHISRLWSVLKRPADEVRSGTLIPLPYPYIVPGGRFREIYYWDSYFTMLGLRADDEVETIRNMIDNFSYLIDTLGFIPNGNRTYYLGRSQPPFYAAMVSLLVEIQGDSVLAHYLSSLEKEYAFWMDGADGLSEQQNTHRRVVKLAGGEVLNRYWDDFETPRPESYLEDIETAEEAIARFPTLTKEKVYRNLRAAAESGWDFSSRWLTADKEGNFALSTIHTTDIVPVDLNALLYNLEYTLYRAYEMVQDSAKAADMLMQALKRKDAIKKYCWNNKQGFFEDFDFVANAQTGVLSIAGMYPLFFEATDSTHAVQAAHTISESFLKPGGVPATLHQTGQQWDGPNGWAPLEWITIQGLRSYHQNALADEVAERWLQLNENVYQRTLKFTEKYNVMDLSMTGGGGEYPNQDGFGWTNGVFQQLSKEHSAIMVAR